MILRSSEVHNACTQARIGRKTPGNLSLAAASRLADNILKDLQPLSQEAAARNQTVNILSKPDLIRKLRG
jgi:hypothetical protein